MRARSAPLPRKTAAAGRSIVESLVGGKKTLPIDVQKKGAVGEALLPMNVVASGERKDAVARQERVHRLTVDLDKAIGEMPPQIKRGHARFAAQHDLAAEKIVVGVGWV